ncbi:restriction endonuclease subunit S [Helicobacter sp. 11S02596-1]|uniref:restriction endonuclease subunit S n=1 Tax=Helicobacter sp. 11S02596-1 TaxID=1476194 RepID=UPI000BA5DD31|nr:restriction endonuclease subunit S [Helicobacter sp. 11S02596-1]PAF44531.1 restriction endonuclease subunit S [Helicobacter sp. 11S02596-1]
MHPFLKKLLDGENVEWKPLGEVAEIRKGEQLNKEFLTQTTTKTMGYPAYNGGITFSGFTNKFNYPENTIIISQGGASAGFVNFVDTKFWANAHCYVVLPNTGQAANKYIYYFLKSKQVELMQKQHGAGIPALRASEIINLPIPIPAPNNPEKSLAIQNEIVRMLDTFTKLISELTRELGLRKKQYQYYRDKLLDFKNATDFPFLQKLLNGAQVEWKPLGEIGEIIRGNGLQKKDFTETGVPAIHYGQIYTFYGLSTETTQSFVSEELAKKLSKVNCGDVVITNTSENLEDVGKALVYLGEKQAVTGGHASIFKPSSEIIGKYFAYYTQTAIFFDEKRKYAKGTKVIDISARDLAKIIIPIPPIETQNQIVDILDKFDALTHSLTEGLPKEIELRKKQYAYYRDLLLNFPKEESSRK